MTRLGDSLHTGQTQCVWSQQQDRPSPILLWESMLPDPIRAGTRTLPGPAKDNVQPVGAADPLSPCNKPRYKAGRPSKLQ